MVQIEDLHVHRQRRQLITLLPFPDQILPCLNLPLNFYSVSPLGRLVLGDLTDLAVVSHYKDGIAW